MFDELIGVFQQRNLEGYVGFANLPNQVYRKSVKRGFEFTLMVVGKSHNCVCVCACVCVRERDSAPLGILNWVCATFTMNYYALTAVF